MRILALVVPLAAIAALTAAPTALAAPERIAVVDMVELITKHPRALELQRKLEQRQQEAEEYARQENDRLRRLGAEIDLMARNNPVRKTKEKDLLAQTAMLKFELEWRKDQALSEYLTGLENLYAEVQRLIARYAREQGFQLVLQKSDDELRAVDANDYGAKVRLRSVVFHEPGLDITEQIKAMFGPRPPEPPPAPPGGTR